MKCKMLPRTDECSPYYLHSVEEQKQAYERRELLKKISDAFANLNFSSLDNYFLWMKKAILENFNIEILVHTYLEKDDKIYRTYRLVRDNYVYKPQFEEIINTGSVYYKMNDNDLTSLNTSNIKYLDFEFSINGKSYKWNFLPKLSSDKEWKNLTIEDLVDEQRRFTAAVGLINYDNKQNEIVWLDPNLQDNENKNTYKTIKFVRSEHVKHLGFYIPINF